MLGAIIFKGSKTERDAKMPTVTIDGPKIEDGEIKRGLAKEITDALEKAYKIRVKVK